MKILVDILGGDTAPKNMVEGAIMAMQQDPELTCVLVGDENYARPEIEKAGLLARTEFLHTTENIAFDEQPTQAVRRSNTSMMMAFDKLKSGDEYSAVVSAGSTGALLAGGVLKVGRIEGVSRPTLCPPMPTNKPGVKVILADAGANVDCKPIHLVHFALMTDAYSRLVLGVKSPRIALVNVGTEDTKGNELTNATFPVLKALHERGAINFVGNMEARDVLGGDFDAIICDGFVGNVLLKSLEGAIKIMGKKVKQVCTASIFAKIGALFLRKGLRKMKESLSEDATGGSPLLGTKKPVIKAHGNSSALAFKNAILVGATAARSNVNDAIKEALEKHKDLIAEMTTEKK